MYYCGPKNIDLTTTLQQTEIRVQNSWDLLGIALYLKLKINFYRDYVLLNIISTRVNNEDTLRLL